MSTDSSPEELPPLILGVIPTAIDSAGIPFARIRFCIFVAMVVLNISSGSLDSKHQMRTLRKRLLWDSPLENEQSPISWRASHVLSSSQLNHHHWNMPEKLKTTTLQESFSLQFSIHDELIKKKMGVVIANILNVAMQPL